TDFPSFCTVGAADFSSPPTSGRIALCSIGCFSGGPLAYSLDAFPVVDAAAGGQGSGLAPDCCASTGTLLSAHNAAAASNDLVMAGPPCRLQTKSRGSTAHAPEGFLLRPSSKKRKTRRHGCARRAFVPPRRGGNVLTTTSAAADAHARLHP